MTRNSKSKQPLIKQPLSGLYCRLHYALLCLLILSPGLLAATPSLDAQGSAYLKMHQPDPIHWRNWSPDVLDTAQRDNQLIFISSGYYACHWCHVMHKESFSNQRIADTLNRHYISVKIDRELSPALDAQLLEFTKATRGFAGWPLQVILTPQGYPLLGFSYQQPEVFNAAMAQLAAYWQQNPSDLQHLAEAASLSLFKAVPADSSRLTEQQLDMLVKRLYQAVLDGYDVFYGGLGETEKFPQPALWFSLLQLLPHYPDDGVEDAVYHTLRFMARSGLRDPVQGGFFRYSETADWLTPHYEKMLSLNALMVLTYQAAADYYQETEFAFVANDTAQFIDQYMRSPTGGYVTSLSAVDHDNIDGALYRWSPDELEQRLSPAAYEQFKELFVFDFSRSEAQLLVPRESTDLSSAVLGTIRRQLKQASDEFPRDSKELASDNALFLYSLCYSQQQSAPNIPLLDRTRQLKSWLLKERVMGTAILKPSTAVSHDITDYAYTLAALKQCHADKALITSLQNNFVAQFTSERGWRANTHNLLPVENRQRYFADGETLSPIALWRLSGEAPLQPEPHGSLLKEDSLLPYASTLAALVTSGAALVTSGQATKQD